MRLQHLTDQALLEKIDLLVQSERELLTEILHHLREVDRRRLFAAQGFSSLHDYAIRHLKYSPDQADRRVKAMRLFREIPEIEAAIDAGRLTLTHLGLAQSAFQRERKAGRPFSIEKKKELVDQITGTSTREAEKLTLQASPMEFSDADRIRLVSRDEIEIKFHAKTEVQDKLQRLQGLLAHQNLSMGELIEKLCDLGLEYFDPRKTRGEAKASTHQKSTELARVSSDQGESPASLKIGSFSQTSAEQDKQAQSLPETKIFPPRKKSRKTSAAPRMNSTAELRRQVWRRDQNRCVRCGSSHALQVDHRHPRALGGPDTLDNLRILCRNCNQRAAIEKLGLGKMQRYLN